MDWDNEAKGDLFYDDGDSKKYEEKNEYYYATFIVKSNSLKMNIEHDNYAGMKFLVMDTIRIFVENNAGITFTINGDVVSDGKIERTQNEIKLKNLGLPMDKPFELNWFAYKVDPSADTRIDCSIEMDNLSQASCQSKKCVYDGQASGRVPKCFIPKSVGGYTIKSIAGDRFELQRADDFSLYGGEIESLVVEASYGSVDGMYSLVRIKVWQCFFVVVE